MNMEKEFEYTNSRGVLTGLQVASAFFVMLGVGVLLVRISPLFPAVHSDATTLYATLLLFVGVALLLVAYAVAQDVDRMEQLHVAYTGRR